MIDATVKLGDESARYVAMLSFLRGGKSNAGRTEGGRVAMFAFRWTEPGRSEQRSLLDHPDDGLMPMHLEAAAAAPT
jgi:hypothetical protein